jgi:hypothetical protein
MWCPLETCALTSTPFTECCKILSVYSIETGHRFQSNPCQPFQLTTGHCPGPNPACKSDWTAPWDVSFTSETGRSTVGDIDPRLIGRSFRCRSIERSQPICDFNSPEIGAPKAPFEVANLRAMQCAKRDA